LNPLQANPNNSKHITKIKRSKLSLSLPQSINPICKTTSSSSSSSPLCYRLEDKIDRLREEGLRRKSKGRDRERRERDRIEREELLFFFFFVLSPIQKGGMQFEDDLCPTYLEPMLMKDLLIII